MVPKMLFALLTVVVACSSGEGGRQQAICSGGEVRCFDNYLGTCLADGRSWELVYCGRGQYCDASACRPRVCVPDKPGCIDGDTAYTCDTTGAVKTPVVCEAGTKCVAGLCLEEEPCNVMEPPRCVYDQLVSCSGGGTWTVEQCGEGKACRDNACVDQSCTPEQVKCIDHPSEPGLQVALYCNSNGTDWRQTVCNEDEACTSGFCFPVPAGEPDGTFADAFAGDADGSEEVTVFPFDIPADSFQTEKFEDVPKPEIVETGTNKATINGTEVKFYYLADADWVQGDDTQMLMINLRAKSMDGVPFPEVFDAKQSLDIRLQGIGWRQTGTFECEDASTYAVDVWYRYGKYAQGTDCKDYDYAASQCTVTIDEFGEKGGRIKGTFQAPAMDDCLGDGTSVVIVDGSFDVILN